MFSNNIKQTVCAMQAALSLAAFTLPSCTSTPTSAPAQAPAATKKCSPSRMVAVASTTSGEVETPSVLDYGIAAAGGAGQLMTGIGLVNGVNVSQSQSQSQSQRQRQGQRQGQTIINRPQTRPGNPFTDLTPLP